MRTPTYLTTDDEQKILSYRGVKRPVEVLKEFKIGLTQLTSTKRLDDYNYKNSVNSPKRFLCLEVATLKQTMKKLSYEILYLNHIMKFQC